MHDSIFFCYRFLRVARHPQCSGQDLAQPVHLSCGRHCLWQDFCHLWVQASGVCPYSRIHVRLEATSHHRLGDLHLEGRHHRPLDCLHWGHRRFDL
jgi:hypothetical protein